MAEGADGRRDGRGADLVSRHRRLTGRTFLVSGLTLVSRILGLVREILSAALFGDKSAVFDAFLTGWRVPNLFRRFLGEGALSTSFQTEMTRVETEEGEEAGARLFRETARVLLGLSIAVTLVVMGAVSVMPDAMPLTGWEWLGADPGYVRDLTVRVMPFVILVCLAALAGGALHVRGQFAAPAWAPAALNAVWIGILLALVAGFGISPQGEVDDSRHLEMAHWLAWGVLGAGLVQLGVHVPALRAQGLMGGPKPASSGRGGAWRVIRRSAPLALGAAVYQINVMVDGLMAESLLRDGGPTAHYYANRIQQFPMALIAVAATSAVFPALQAHGARQDRQAVRDLHDRTHRAVAFVALPASVGLFVLSSSVIEAVFLHGAFGEDGVQRTSSALRWLCLAILPAGAAGLVARTYYALGDFRTPVQISSGLLVANALLNWWLVAGAGMDVDGLALATAITTWGNLLLLALGLRRHLGLPTSTTPLAGPLLLMSVAASACGGAALGVQAWLATQVGQAIALPVSIGAGMAVYAWVAHALSVPEARQAAERLTRRGRD